jgi:predicted dehydrogenase
MILLQNMYKVALIGYGFWGKILEKYIEESLYFDLKFIFTHSQKVHPNHTNNLSAILKSEVNFVFIVTPSKFHYEYTKLFLEEGINVCCEKPFVSNLLQIDELYSIAQKNKLILHVNYIYLLSPSINFLKEKLSKVYDQRKIQFSIEQYGKFYNGENAFKVIGCHLLSVLFYLFDDIVIKNLSIETLALDKDEQDQVLYLQENDNEFTFRANLLSNERRRFFQIETPINTYIFNPLEEKCVKIFSNQTQKTIFSKSFDEKNNIRHLLDHLIHSDWTDNLKNKQIVSKVSQILNLVNGKF